MGGEGGQVIIAFSSNDRKIPLNHFIDLFLYLVRCFLMFLCT